MARGRKKGSKNAGGPRHCVEWAAGPSVYIKKGRKGIGNSKIGANSRKVAAYMKKEMAKGIILSRKEAWAELKRKGELS